MSLWDSFRRGPALEAQYAGRCSACGELILPGELIHAEGGEWVHASCDELPPPPPDRRPRCPYCADVVLEDGSCACSD